MVRSRRNKPMPTGPKLFAYWYHLCLLAIWVALLVWLVVLVDPEIVKDVGWKGSYLPIYILLWLTSGWLIGIIRKSVIKGLVWGLTASVFLLMFRYGLGTVVNSGLLLIFILVLEWYWRLDKHPHTPEVN